jgi:hypothetical protein
MLDDYQHPCCPIPGGKVGQYELCTNVTRLHVANYMSYSWDRGHLVDTDELGTRPWTSGQRVHAFTSFFTFRRGLAPKGVDPTCDKWIVYDDPFVTGMKLTKRDSPIQNLQSFVGPDILRQAPNLRDTLKRICAGPFQPNSSYLIDMISGEETNCTDSTCKPPSSGATCPNGENPPCLVLQLCEDNSYPPCTPDSGVCGDGTMPPCSGPSVCPVGQTLKCWTNTTQATCPDGSLPPCATGTGKNTTACPQACDVNFNHCDAETAPNCIFPNPLVAHPRAACACRPGYKASAHADGDTAKQWRLPIVGQEHRVWVAEGVKCDKVCDGYGVDSCREVGEISAACIG